MEYPKIAPLIEPEAGYDPQNLSIPELSESDRERFARHLAREEISEAGQRRLRHAKVLMVGAGGLGSPALLYLAASGVGTIGIVDADVVDLTNLQRQVIHANAAIGELKVESAARRVRDLDPSINVTTYPTRLNDDNIDEILSQYDLVLDGTDNIRTRYVVSDAATRLNMPEVWATVLGWNAQISVFWTGSRAVEAGFPGPDGLRMRDVFPVEPDDSAIPKTADIGLMGIVPGQAGTIMAAEAVKLITGTGYPLVGRVMMIDIWNAKTYEIPYAL